MVVTGCSTNFESRVGDEASAGSGTTLTPSESEGSPTARRSSARVQQEVMDFSDQFSTDLRAALDDYVAAEPDVERQVEAQRLQIGLVTSSMMIAASRDPRANLLDMAVFISAGRWAADRYWVPELLGERASGLRAAFAEAEAEIWEEVDEVLTAAQAADLRALIANWKQGARPRDVRDVRLRNLDGVVLSQFQEAPSANELLASVKRFLGSVDQSLLTGERMLFYLERLPLLLERQADLTVDRVAERFPIATLNPDFAGWVDLANTVPGHLGDLYAAHANDLAAEMERVWPEVRGGLDTTERIADSVRGTAESVDALAEKIAALPFSQDEYVTALGGTVRSLEQLNGVVDGLNELLDQTAPGEWEARVAELTAVVDERSARAMDAVFWRAAALIGMAVVGALLVVLAARVGRRRVAVAPTNANGE